MKKQQVTYKTIEFFEYGIEKTETKDMECMTDEQDAPAVHDRMEVLCSEQEKLK